MAACNCIGPQNGRPLCPCRMRYVQVRDGRYVLPEQDLGPCESSENERANEALKKLLTYAESLPKPWPTTSGERPMSTLSRTLGNWRWWAVILPMSVISIPLVAVDLLLASIIWIGNEVAYEARIKLASAWSSATGPMRRWVYAARRRAEGGDEVSDG